MINQNKKNAVYPIRPGRRNLKMMLLNGLATAHTYGKITGRLVVRVAVVWASEAADPLPHTDHLA